LGVFILQKGGYLALSLVWSRLLMNLYFWLALLMSLLGPIFYYLIASRTNISRFFDGLIVTALVCLVTLHILPESLEHSTLTTIIAVALGLLGPLFLSQLTKRSQCEIQKPFLIISIFGFVAHNMLDGAALIVHPDAQGSTHLLALAVAIHRFVESIALWKTLSRSFGAKMTALCIVGLALAMAAGYFFGEQIFTRMDPSVLYVLQALACGMIFHILLHPHHLKDLLHEAKAGHYPIKAQSIGAFCGLIIALLAYLLWPAHNHSSPPEGGEIKTHAETKSE
jgi:zinc transporter ZupT